MYPLCGDGSAQQWNTCVVHTHNSEEWCNPSQEKTSSDGRFTENPNDTAADGAFLNALLSSGSHEPTHSWVAFGTYPRIVLI
jgi:hypothetical protein